MTAHRSRPTYAVAAWLFLRVLGFVYLFAFWSIARQVTGLIGSDGILPATGWLAGRDWALHVMSIGGSLLAAVLVLGFAPVPILATLWALYLAITIAMGEFLSYQWDSLLLETGLLSVVIAPLVWRHRLRDAVDPPRMARILLWWLLFRLMLGSGIVKLASGDPAWRGLTAMMVHYETQPLPTPLAWYAAQLPAWLHQATTALVLAIELVVPWSIAGGRRIRRAGAAVLIALQLIIASTGNYAFFNLLTIALCLLMLDDDALAWLRRSGPSIAPVTTWKRELLPVALAIVTVPLSVSLLASQLGRPFPSSLAPLAIAVDPLRSVNAYGLFAVMTTERNEIVVEGSRDGKTWLEYEFKHKPGSITRRPSWVAPFQPRLDWQMWFAALNTYGVDPWFDRFLLRLQDGSPAVVGLLDHNPFPTEPPQYVRAILYRYRFSGRGQPTWWTREAIGEYAAPRAR